MLLCEDTIHFKCVCVRAKTYRVLTCSKADDCYQHYYKTVFHGGKFDMKQSQSWIFFIYLPSLTSTVSVVSLIPDQT